MSTRERAEKAVLSRPAHLSGPPATRTPRSKALQRGSGRTLRERTEDRPADQESVDLPGHEGREVGDHRAVRAHPLRVGARQHQVGSIGGPQHGRHLGLLSPDHPGEAVPLDDAGDDVDLAPAAGRQREVADLEEVDRERAVRRLHPALRGADHAAGEDGQRAVLVEPPAAQALEGGGEPLGACLAAGRAGGPGDAGCRAPGVEHVTGGGDEVRPTGGRAPVHGDQRAAVDGRPFDIRLRPGAPRPPRGLGVPRDRAHKHRGSAPAVPGEDPMGEPVRRGARGATSPEPHHESPPSFQWLSSDCSAASGPRCSAGSPTSGVASNALTCSRISRRSDIASISRCPSSLGVGPTLIRPRAP